MLRARVLVPLALLAAAGVGWWLRSGPPRVRTARATSGRVLDVVYATGVIRPDTETRVGAEVAGRIAELLADEGDRVVAGMPLARLDDALARARVEEARRRLEAARARLAQAAAPTDPWTIRQLEAQARAAAARRRAAQERAVGAERRVETLRAGIGAAEAALESAGARLGASQSAERAARAEVEAAQDRVRTAQSEVAQAAATLEAARDLHERRTRLFAEGAIAERMMTESRTAMDAAAAAREAVAGRARTAETAVRSAGEQAAAAAAQVREAAAAQRAAESSLQSARSQAAEAEAVVKEMRRAAEAAREEEAALQSQLGQARRGARQVDLEPLRTDVRTAGAAVEEASEDLQRFTVRAPVSGTITRRSVDPGDFAGAGAVLFTIANEQQIYLRADVDEADLGLVRLGARVQFRVDAHPERTYTGRVAFIARAADAATKTYAVEVRELNRLEGLRIGMTADVNVEGREDPDAVLVPSAVLATVKDGVEVWVVDADNRVRRRTVRIKARDAERVQVLEGLRAGEEAVIQPAGRLADGQEVRR